MSPNTARRSHRPKARGPRPAVPFTFICCACEAVEHRPTPTLPAGWMTEAIGNDIYAYCAEHAIDLPGASESLL